MTQAKPNMKLLENPYLLKDPDEGLDPFLSDLTDLEPLALARTESAPVSSTLFEGASSNLVEEDPQTMMTTTLGTMDLLAEEDLLMKTLIATCRIMFPSPLLLKSEPWDPYPESLTETEPKPMPSSPNSWDT